MVFKVGDKRPAGAGRKPGQANKITRSMREAYEATFNTLQDDPIMNLTMWAYANISDFYKLSSKLLPVDMAVQGGITLNVITGVPVRPDEIEQEDEQPALPAPPESDGSDLC